MYASHIYPSLVLAQPRKTRPCLTERLLMGRKELNQTKPFFYATHCFDQMHIPMIVHEDITDDYQVIMRTRMKITQNKHKNNQRAITLKWETITIIICDSWS